MSQRASSKKVRSCPQNPKGLVGSTSKLLDVVKQGGNSLWITSRLVRDVTDGADNSASQILESVALVVVTRLVASSGYAKHEHRLRRSLKHLHEFLSQFSDDDQQTVMKYFFDILMCRVFEDDARPPMPEVLLSVKIQTPWSGWLNSFVKRLIARCDRSLCYSFAKGSKQCWPALSEKKKQATLEKHREHFSTCHGTLDFELKTQIEIVVGKVFLPPKKGKVDVSLRKFFPTGKSCTQSSFSKGGTYAIFSEFQPSEKKFENVELRFSKPDATIDSGMVSSSHEIKTLQMRPMDGFFSWKRTHLMDFVKRSFDDCCISQDNGFLYDQGHSQKVFALAEPGKYRTVTIGDGYQYTALQPIQGELLSKWKHSRFSTMLHSDLTEKVNELQSKLSDFPFFCSVDYESATDKLKKSCTFAFLGALPDDYPFLGLMYQSFLPTRVTYPKASGLSPVYSIDAQPMGHPLSFPMLCAINLAVWWETVRVWETAADVKNIEHRIDEMDRRRKHSRRLKDYVIVNGDDMLFKCDDVLYRIFLQVSARAGFKISQGKNYLSRHTCMINSQVFGLRGDGVIQKYGYLNQRFTSGVNVKGGDSHGAMATEIAVGVNEMIRSAQWTKPTLAGIAKRCERDIHTHTNFRPNWFLPVHLGGFGFDVQYADKFVVTRDQRLMAARFVNNPKLALIRRQMGDGLRSRFFFDKELSHVGEVKLIPNVRPFVSEREYADLDELFAQLTEVLMASNFKGVIQDRSLNEREFYQRALRHNRCKPMSDEGIQKWWDAVLVPKKLLPRFPSPQLPIVMRTMQMMQEKTFDVSSFALPARDCATLDLFERFCKRVY